MPLLKNNQLAHILLVLALVIFTFFKSQHTTIPYFLDELNFYAPAVNEMYKAGPSLSPETIPVVYSRGHPLLFHYLVSNWMRVFGSSIESIRYFGITSSLLLIIGVYILCGKLFDYWSGLTVATLTLTQSIFLAQTGLVLPEMTLALFLVVSLLAYLAHYKSLFWIAAACAIMTKESAIILFLALPTFLFIQFIFYKSFTFKSLLKETFFVISPITVWLLFLVWQKLTLGWFLFPEHTGIMNFTPEIVWEKFSRILLIVFIWNGHNALTVSIIALISFYIVKEKKTMPQNLMYIILLLGVFIIYFAAFSSVNFFTNRYLLSLHIILCILGGITIIQLVQSRRIQLLAIVALTGIGLYFILTNRSYCDHNLGYTDKENSNQIKFELKINPNTSQLPH